MSLHMETQQIWRNEDGEDFLFATQLATGSVFYMAMQVAVELDLFAIIKKAGPNVQISPRDIASQLPTQNPSAASMLDRILRLLTSYSILTSSLVTRESGLVERLYGLGSVCKYFVPNEDGVTISALMLLIQDKVFMDSWWHMKDAILEGGIPFNKAHGMHAFEYPGANARYNGVFNKAMLNHTTLVIYKGGFFPGVYLGLPLGSTYKRIGVWQDLLDPLRQRLAHWKRRYLTKSGRLVLIKSTLAAVPVYMLSLFKIPRTVALEMEHIMKGFLWGSSSEKRKIYLMAWEDMCTPKEWGGLGLRRVEDINLSLLWKWLWELGEEGDALWKRLMFQKYGQRAGQWYTNQPNGTCSLSLWRPIMQCCVKFEKYVVYRCGVGNKIRFWQDIWIGSSPLCIKFKSLFELSRKQTGVVSEFRVIEGGNQSWNIFPKRRFSDGEIGEAMELSVMLSGVELSDMEDTRGWLEVGRNYSPKSCCAMLGEERRLREERGIPNFPHRSVWVNDAPPKTCFMMWTLARECILSQENLQRRGYNLASKCVFCGKASESVRHLFMECEEVVKNWDYFYGCMGQIWSKNKQVLDMLRNGASSALTPQGKYYWKFMHHVVCYAIWLERNLRIFEDTENPIWRLTAWIKETLWQWGWARERPQGSGKRS